MMAMWSGQCAVYCKLLDFGTLVVDPSEPATRTAVVIVGGYEWNRFFVYLVFRRDITR